MTHPEWALKYKTKNTELRCIKGKYYLYNITSVWSPEKKRTKKVTLDQVGTISEEYGLIPTGMKRKGRIPAGESPFIDIPKEEVEFLDKFENIEDPRALKNQLYSVAEILLLTLCAVICGACGWSDVESFGRIKLNYLRQYLDYNNGTPSDDTIRRFFRNLDPDIFAKLFREWVENLAKTIGSKVIAIDGKSSRHSFDGDGNMLHMISAFATEARIVLGQEKVSDKSNEITAIPKMLDWLDVKGHIVTIDAMGCQYEIANQIIKKEGNYIFALKGNQGNLSDDIKLYFEDNMLYSEDTKLEKTSSHIDYDKRHGRLETRECRVTNNLDWLSKRHDNWQTIKSIIEIKSIREIKGKITKETRYYISSLNISADKILESIRSHWAIENSLHWVLDMSFNEDYSRIRKENAPHVMAILRHIAINLLQNAKKNQDSFKRKSIAGLRRMCGWDEKTLDLVISQKLL
ncbi:MAG: ISAs1 family transposase [Pseudomonadota bacterium]